MAFKNSWIKCLIWLGFLFVSSAITTGLAYAGVRLGGVPTILLFAVACYAARSCCKAYDRKHAPLPSVADTGEEPKSASLVARRRCCRRAGRAARKPGRSQNGRNYPAPESQERAAGAACQGEQTAPRLAETGHSYPLGTGGRTYCILLLARAGKPVETCQRSHPIPDPDPYPWNK